MSAIRRSAALPIPGAEIQRLRDTLAPRYGAVLWKGEEESLLALRVPGAEADLVNDIELAVEHLDPGELEGQRTVLLIGSQRVHAVPAEPFQQLMADRVAFDDRQCQALRSQLPRPGHAIHRPAEDARRLSRLAIRLARAHVRDLDDEDLGRLADDLGPHLEEAPYRAVHAVYLVADDDHVRLGADVFLHDLRERWGDEARRAARAEDERLRQEAERRRKDEERRRIVQELEARIAKRTRVAYAPLRTPAPAAHWEAPGPAAPAGQAWRSELEARFGRPAQPAAAPARASVASLVDAIPSVSIPAAPVGASASAAQESPLANPGEASAAPGDAAPAPTPPTDSPGAAPASPLVYAPPLVGGDAILSDLRSRLERDGYDVLVHPQVPGHALDLAAERPTGYPQRLVARLAGRLTVPVAQEMLAAAKSLDVDLAVIVAPDADAEAKRLLVATKGKHLAPADLGSFLA